MTPRLRAVRDYDPQTGTYDLMVYAEPSGKPLAYVPMVQVPTLMNDLRLAVRGEELAPEQTS